MPGKMITDYTKDVLLRTHFHPFGILVFKQSRSRKLCKSAPTASREEEYQGISAEDKVRSDPCAARNEVNAALRHFKSNGSFPEQKESTVRGWKNAYCAQLSSGLKKRGVTQYQLQSCK